MSEICRITVPLDPAPLSPNRDRRPGTMAQERRRRFAEKRRKEEAKETALWAWRSAGRPRARVPVIVTLIIRRQRVLDDDNAYRGLKCVRDALFNGAITPHDSPKYFSYAGIRFETGKQWKGREEVVFIVEPRNQLQIQPKGEIGRCNHTKKE